MSPSREAELRALIAKPFAHRGLHGAGRMENSRAAFQAAIEARHGIELDVQISGDGQAVVFHDEWLHRLAADEGMVRGRTVAELARIKLRDSDETIPALPEILALITGRAPLLIEVKAPNREVGALCRAVSDALKGYTGPVAVMSFNPEVGHWFARYDAARLRGLVVTEKGKPWRGLKVTTWTVRTMADRARAAEHADQIIYEVEAR